MKGHEILAEQRDENKEFFRTKLISVQEYIKRMDVQKAALDNKQNELKNLLTTMEEMTPEEFLAKRPDKKIELS